MKISSREIILNRLYAIIVVHIVTEANFVDDAIMNFLSFCNKLSQA